MKSTSYPGMYSGLVNTTRLRQSIRTIPYGTVMEDQKGVGVRVHKSNNKFDARQKVEARYDVDTW